MVKPAQKNNKNGNGASQNKKGKQKNSSGNKRENGQGQRGSNMNDDDVSTHYHQSDISSSTNKKHSNKKRKHNKSHHKTTNNHPQSKIDNNKSHTNTTNTTITTTTAATSQPQHLPLPFPSHLPTPPNDFLRQDDPRYEESFETAVRTSYLGLAVDDPSLLQEKYQSSTSQQQQQQRQQPLLNKELPLMNQLQFFQTDVTQPFGLGTKCAKTYVTRCLVGDPGTTYKYLGLRMFAYHWNHPTQPNITNASSNNEERHRLLSCIRTLKDDVLVPQTQHHLQALHTTRQSQHGIHYEPSRSRPQYNICLINRMDSAAAGDYKWEPTLEHDKIAVAWHADSSLEHYSNIAVYQLILNGSSDNEEKPLPPSTQNDWSLAVRTTPHAEGPTIQADHAPDTSIPTLSLKLPSGSAYYMLDDFNHHHQHAVLRDHGGEGEGKNKRREDTTTATNTNTTSQQQQQQTIRYSATYRLLRPSHTVQEVLEQCHKATRNFHKRGSKVWRSEQLLLNHIESEWIRQFYIQGQHHYDMLWPDHWGMFIQQLWQYWSQLEQRTRQILDLLQHAAEGKCHATKNASSNSSTLPVLSKAERKQRDKQKKAYATLDALLARSGSGSSDHPSDSHCAYTDIYEPMAALLEERASLRSLWRKREKDHVFMTMERQYRPLPLPICYQSSLSPLTEEGNSDKGAVARSPLPEDLSGLAKRLREYGKAYETASVQALPLTPIVPPLTTQQLQQSPDNHSTATTTNTATTTTTTTSSTTTKEASKDKEACRSSNGNEEGTRTMGQPGNSSKPKRKKKKKKRGTSSEDGTDGAKRKKKRRF